MSASFGTIVVCLSENFKGDVAKIGEYLTKHLSIGDGKFEVLAEDRFNKNKRLILNQQIEYPSLDFGRYLDDDEEGDDDYVPIDGEEVVKQLREFIDEGILYISTTSYEKTSENKFEFLQISNSEWATYSFDSYTDKGPNFKRYLSSGNNDEDLVIKS